MRQTKIHIVKNPAAEKSIFKKHIDLAKDVCDRYARSIKDYRWREECKSIFWFDFFRSVRLNPAKWQTECEYNHYRLLRNIAHYARVKVFQDKGEEDWILSWSRVNSFVPTAYIPPLCFLDMEEAL